MWACNGWEQVSLNWSNQKPVLNISFALLVNDFSRVFKLISSPIQVKALTKSKSNSVSVGSIPQLISCSVLSSAVIDCGVSVGHVLFSPDATCKASFSGGPNPPDAEATNPALDTESIVGLVIWFVCVLYSSIRTASSNEQLIGSDKVLAKSDTGSSGTLISCLRRPRRKPD